MISAKTYICGDLGSVGRIDNLVGPLIDISLTPGGIVGGTGYLLLDIDVDPNNANKVFVVGEGRCDNLANPAANFYGIGVSSNAGSTWQLPGGNYQTIMTPSFCYHKWYEVSIVDSNVIYICGRKEQATNKGTVIKSTDGGLTFNKCNPLPSTVDGMDCTSIHFTDANIGVVGLNNYAVKTTDGGVTWTVLNGGASFASTGDPVGQITGIHISADETNIVAVGFSRIIKTLQVPPGPSGIALGSWSTVMPLNNNSGYHLTAFDDSTMVMGGYSDTIMSSSDAGATWVSSNPLPPTTLSGPNRLAANYYKKTVSTLEGFYSGGTSLYNTLSGATTIPLPPVVVTFPVQIAAVATWYDESVPPTCYLLTPCGSGSSIVTNTDLSGYIGSIVKILGNSGCFTVSISNTCSGAIGVIVASEFVSCLACDPKCYLLTDCEGILPSVLVNNDLSASVGHVITIHGQSTCWIVSNSPGCSGSVSVIVDNIYTTCQDCHPVCYKLVDCNNNGNLIITDHDLFLYVGKVIKLEDYGNVCWTVENIDNCIGSVPISPITDVFDVCEDCLPNPPEPKEVTLNPRRVKPGYYTPGCSPEYTEHTNCSFSDRVYNDMIGVRYGIANCCDEKDTDKWDIKKQLLDMKAMFDPEMCQSACFCNCPCPTDVTVLLERFYPPMPCTPPSDVETSIQIPPGECPEPENLHVGISI